MTRISAKEIALQLRRKRSSAMAQAVVSAFTERLQEEAVKQGGYLSQAHIKQLDIEFQAKADQLTNVFEQAFQDAAREQEELKWSAIKRPAFDRLIVKRFEHLFVHRGADGIPHGSVSRRLLPGFFLALNMMLGPDDLRKFHNRCDLAVDRIMKGKLPVDWDFVDKDAEILEIILDAQYAIAVHFEDTARRSTWFTQIVNSHLAPPTHDHAADANWELSHRALHMLLNGLMSDLHKAVSDDLAWRHFKDRHPEADRTSIAVILERFD
ncbi:hypothetical protein [Magnetovibrio blakemorei]|uniref:Uncharacterized protein n=1 Tax=Magnetovibrio blakemorei TaxID=28181 RepID=A0A1E5Q8C5_9PROT|nr:hypothetical protein [Magnetovibrio blakemorei]OEJ67613.1 hypothetical protein BEN30_09340 [Magnetovibrio blakemorei]